jgi:hypothetical protein
MISKPRKTAVLTETQVHLQVVDYLRKAGFDADVIWTHIRGERAGAFQRILAAKMGVTPKVPDFIFIYNRIFLFIELKKAGFHRKKTFNEHELAQMMMHNRLRSNGAFVEICETLDAVKDVLWGYGFPLRNESITSERIRRGVLTALSEDAE